MRPLWLCLVFLFMWSAGSSLAAEPASDDVTLYHNDSGTLVFGGNVIGPPRTLEVRDIVLVFNGLTLAPASTRVVTKRPTTPDIQAAKKISRRVYQREKNRGHSQTQIAATIRDSCAQLTSLGDIEVSEKYVRSAKLHVGWPLEVSTSPLPAKALLQRQLLRNINDCLTAGGVAFVTADGLVTGGASLATAIDKTIHDQPLTTAEAQELTSDMQELIRHPLPLIPAQ